MLCTRHHRKTYQSYLSPQPGHHDPLAEILLASSCGLSYTEEQRPANTLRHFSKAEAQLYIYFIRFSTDAPGKKYLEGLKYHAAMFTFSPLQGALSESAASQSILELDGGIKILVGVGWDESFDVAKLKELEK
jgi:hypothetical protein